MTLASTKLRILVSGLIGQYPMGGVTWDYLQYALGLHRMGHEVYYLEDTGQWPYDPTVGGLSAGYEPTVSYLDSVMRSFDLGDRWMYRFPWGPRWFGLSDPKRQEIIATADLVINVSGTLRAPDEVRGRASLVYIDTDPVFTQLKLVRGQRDFRVLVDAHDIHFSFGELIGIGRSKVPDSGHNWIPTRQPVVLEEWSTPPDSPSRDAFTTVMNWTSYKPVTYDGRTYGQKDVEMERFMALPARVDAPLEIAIGAGKTKRTPYGMLRRNGWRLVDPDVVCADPWKYRDYIRTSLAEWSVAKGGYVVGWSGWFSCRTACYMAAGRPAVVQDTGFGELYPTGIGLLPFGEVDEARERIIQVMRAPTIHSKAAREIAEASFGATNVLADLIDRAMAPRQAAAEDPDEIRGSANGSESPSL